MIWVKMAGVFRYLHPLDPPERVEEQRLLIEEARELLLAGEPIEEVALSHSQGGTKALGGILPKKLLSAGEVMDDRLASLPVGAVTPVFRVGNGYWVYTILEKGGGERVPYDKVEWAERRALFREKLAATLADALAEVAASPEVAARGGDDDEIPHSP